MRCLFTLICLGLLIVPASAGLINGDFETSLTDGWDSTTAFQAHRGLCATGLDEEGTQAAYVTDTLGNVTADTTFINENAVGSQWQLDLLFAAAEPASDRTMFLGVNNLAGNMVNQYGLLVQIEPDGVLKGFDGTTGGGGTWTPFDSEVTIDWSIDANSDGDFADVTDTLNVYSLRIIGDYTTTPSYDVYLSGANDGELVLLAEDVDWFFAADGGGDEVPTAGSAPVSFIVRQPGYSNFVIDQISMTTTAVPEPSTLVLLLGGIGMLLWNRRRRA